MGMLGAKFMHAGCFDHPYFGPLLETYSLECLAKKRNPSAPFILSVIAAHFDTSAGSAVSEKDLYATRCGGKNDQHLQDFVSQVDYVMSQMKATAIPSERNLFDFFYREVQGCYAIKRHVEAIRDVPEEDEDAQAEAKNFTTFRSKVVRELSHLQMQKIDYDTKDGVMNVPLAISEKRYKAEAARAVAKKEKERGREQDNGGARLRDWSQPRPGLTAGAIGAPQQVPRLDIGKAQNDEDGLPPPPPAPVHDRARNQGSWKGGDSRKGEKGAKSEKGEKGKGEKGKGKGNRKGKSKGQNPCFTMMNRGGCDKPDCPYNHDEKFIAASKVYYEEQWRIDEQNGTFEGEAEAGRGALVALRAAMPALPTSSPAHKRGTKSSL